MESLHFNVTPIESKKNVDNLTRNRHGIAGYLSDEDVQKKIYAALVSWSGARTHQVRRSVWMPASARL